MYDAPTNISDSPRTDLAYGLPDGLPTLSVTRSIVTDDPMYAMEQAMEDQAIATPDQAPFLMVEYSIDGPYPAQHMPRFAEATVAFEASGLNGYDVWFRWVDRNVAKEVMPDA